VPLTYAGPLVVKGVDSLFFGVVPVVAWLLLRGGGVKVERPAGRTTLTPAPRSRHWRARTTPCCSAHGASTVAKVWG